MKNGFSWRVAARIAWRDARASTGQFLFIVLAVGIGVGALTGVRGFSAAFRHMLLRDARVLMAADLSVRDFHVATPDERRLLSDFDARGIEHTWVTETVSSMGSGRGGAPFLVSIKAVEPGKYPFYGTVELEPPGDLADVLTDDSIVVSQDLLIRLGGAVGDSARLGDETFRVAAVVRVEPDRMTGTMNVGPRVLFSRGALGRSGLMAPGSRASQRYLFRLPPEGLSISDARKRLETVFDGALVADYRETHPTIRRGLDRATNFLGLVSLIALIVGALGVGMAMHSHLQQKLDSLAIMKCIGGRSAQIIRIYLLQTLALGAAGSGLGVLAGYGVQAWFPTFIATYFPEAPALEWQPIVAFQGMAVGLLTTLLFTLPPLLAIRDVRPALVFRREMAAAGESPGGGKKNPASLRFAVLIVAALAGLAAWVGDSLLLGAWFAVGLLGSLAVLGLVSHGLLRLLRTLPRRLPWRLPPSLRHGIANLHRPGVHADAILVALGIGVTFTLAVYLIQSSVVTQMVRSAPPDMPNLFMVNIASEDRDGLRDLLEGYPGIEGDVELTPSVAARLLTVDGVPLEEINAEQGRRRRRWTTRSVTWSEQKPEHTDVIRGRWWSPEEGRKEVAAFLASVRESTAERLGIEVGSQLEWQVGAEQIGVEVAAIHRTEAIRPGSTVSFFLTPNALEDVPAIYYGSVRIAPDQAADLQRLAFEHFPSVTVISVADVLRIVQEVIDQIALVIRFISAFAILGGVMILVSSVMATRFRRIQETAILKALGATRRRVMAIFSVEFLVLGVTAGLLGSVLATLISRVLLEQILDAQPHFDVVPLVVAVFGTALVVNLAGWLASFHILGKKPLEVLRSE